MREQTDETTLRGEALDWLSGRLRWERILRELHDQARATAASTKADPEADGQAA